jgi:hypothetical protein
LRLVTVLEPFAESNQHCHDLAEMFLRSADLRRLKCANLDGNIQDRRAFGGGSPSEPEKRAAARTDCDLKVPGASRILAFESPRVFSV